MSLPPEVTRLAVHLAFHGYEELKKSWEAHKDAKQAGFFNAAQAQVDTLREKERLAEIAEKKHRTETAEKKRLAENAEIAENKRRTQTAERKRLAAIDVKKRLAAIAEKKRLDENARKLNPLELASSDARQNFVSRARKEVEGLLVLRHGMEELQLVPFKCLTCDGIAVLGGSLTCGKCGTRMGAWTCSRCGHLGYYSGAGESDCPLCGLDDTLPPPGPMTREGLVGQLDVAITHLNSIVAIYDMRP